MINLIAPASYIFVGTWAVKLFRNSINVTNSTNPLVFTKNITLIVIESCTPFLVVRLAVYCVMAGSFIAASVVSLSPLTISSAIHVVTKIS